MPAPTTSPPPNAPPTIEPEIQPVIEAIFFPAKLVFANHFDAHWLAFGPEQMDVSVEGRASVGRFPDEVHACSPETNVVIPALLRVIEF